MATKQISTNHKTYYTNHIVWSQSDQETIIISHVLKFLNNIKYLMGQRKKYNKTELNDNKNTRSQNMRCNKKENF
jgi:hypothetical protein